MLLAFGALPLGGCAAGLAASAVTAAVRAADGPEKVPTENPGPAARAACTARAAPHGTVRIIDTVRKSAAKLVVWGAVDGDGGRRSFQCRWHGEIVGFEIKEIETRR
jgi:hypothetical protein